ncbi:MAG: hypothetical protein A3G23_13545 [Bacteroidetes bacterium RIFCSPLOWO2_12_FULL_37_12]|nr:MAG: hypothetical protein A3G23_13545 [Bacteroidetes bacterium RIFCSPLOWO2_12_FULL_37_12]
MADTTVIKTEGVVFRWKATTNPLKWVETLVIEIKQQVLLKPVGSMTNNKPYLMIYEADRENWDKKTLSDNKGLEPILAIEGEFNNTGSFVITKIIPSIKEGHLCRFGLLIKDIEDKTIQLKDRNGNDVDNIEVYLPPIDKNDEAWYLDLSFRSSKDYERYQDRLVLDADLSQLLKGSKYQDDRFDGKGKDKHTKYIEKSVVNRKSYDYLYVHCAAAASESITEWYEFANVRDMFSNNEVGAHFIIDREGNIYHMVKNSAVARHAKGGNSNAIGIEMTGLIDDLSIALLLSRALIKLSKSPPTPSSGSLTIDTKEFLKKVVNFLCYGSSRKTYFMRRAGKMIDVISSNYLNTDFSSLTAVWVSNDRDKWEEGIVYYSDPAEIVNIALQILYWNVLKAKIVGNNILLKVTNRESIKVKLDKCKCINPYGVDLDTKEEGITLYRMSKDQELQCTTEDKTIFVNVSKTDITDYNNKLLDKVLKKEIKRGNAKERLEIIEEMIDEQFNKLIGYTDAQYASLADLTQALHQIYQFKHVVSHHFADHKRKRDPGSYFDWDKYISHNYLKEMRMLNGFKWDINDDNRKPKEFAERIHAGKWG